MRRLLVPLAAAGLLVPQAPVTAAPSAGSTHTGGCRYSDLDTTGVPFGAQYFLTIAVVLYSTDPLANPVTATITCTFRVDGAWRSKLSVTRTGAILMGGPQYRSWTATEVPDMCTTVDYADDTPTWHQCGSLESNRLLPPVA